MAEETKEQTIQNSEFKIDDRHVETLKFQASRLNRLHALVGARMCETMKNIQEAITIEESITELQESIANDLKVPRSNRLIWNLDRGTVSVPEND